MLYTLSNLYARTLSVTTLTYILSKRPFASSKQTCQQASQPAGSLRLAGLVFSEAIGWLAGLIG
jgi:hypothetical protein